MSLLLTPKILGRLYASRDRSVHAVTKRRSLLIGTMVAGLSASVPASSADAGEPPRFEATDCRGVADIAEILPRLRCGIVRVPRDHADPNGASYALAVIVIKSERQPPLPDPVVYISGGPGGPLTVYAGYQARHPYAADRDLILVDQRGTGRSEPHLCPDLQVELSTAMLSVVTEPTPAALAKGPSGSRGVP